MKTSYFNICAACFIILLFAGTLYAQTTSLQLPTAADSSSSFRVLNSDGTARLRINSDGGFCVYGSGDNGYIPATGEGARLMWYPLKGAFRAGYVDATQWDDANIGYQSTAMGIATIASGNASTAIGSNTTASNNYSTALGGYTTASSIASTAMGFNTTASGDASTAMGYATTANGTNSTSMGYSTTASGGYSTAMGSNTIASGQSSIATGHYSIASGSYSTAMGHFTTASGIYSTSTGYYTIASGFYTTAMGNYVKAANYGSFIFGDNSKSSYDSSSANNQMTMRFAGGYRLFTNSSANIGASLAGGDNTWGTISDSTKKELFIQADGEYFLNSISKLRLGSWNYKSQDPKSFRHYGPMAQEIFYYFGKDTYGTIGNDTTLNTANMDGIMMICLQALEKRTSELQKANEKIAQLEKLVSKQNTKLQAQQTSFDELKKEITKIKSDVQLLTETKSKQANTDVSLNITNKGQ